MLYRHILIRADSFILFHITQKLLFLYKNIWVQKSNNLTSLRVNRITPL